MANNVKMSELMKMIVVEAQSASLEGLIESLQGAINEIQAVNHGPIDVLVAEPKQKAGFSIEVATVVGNNDHFIAFCKVLTGAKIGDLVRTFEYKGYRFWKVTELGGDYSAFGKVICIATYFDPFLLQIIDQIFDDKEDVSMMTPMELIALINKPS